MQPASLSEAQGTFIHGGKPRLAAGAYLIALFGAAAIFLTVVIAYRPLWQALGDPSLLPWGSDTLGHLQRYEFIKLSIQAGNWFPQVMPDWYLGIQLLRYYPPLPYYILYGLDLLMGGSLQALHGFILLWTLLGGLSWLLFRRWVGWVPAILGGVIYVLLPDLVRVAFSEGNLPRVMIAGLTPLLLYLLILDLHGGARPVHRVLLALTMLVVTLTHAMLAAVLAVSLGLFIAACWAFRQVSLKRAALILANLALGIALSCAWLLPSLTGGITELQSGAVSRGLEAVAWADLLNPLFRLQNIESVYSGLAFLLIGLAVLTIKPLRTRQSSVLAGCGLFLAVLPTPQMNAFFSALPFSNLLWPTRFLGIASAFLLLAFLYSLAQWWKKIPWAAALLVALVLVDCAISARLIFLRPISTGILESSQAMAACPGWREATLDESRLGSAASWAYTSTAGREQVFGWGYQGARTASNVAGLNDALTLGRTAYVIDRFALFGVDDVVVLDSLQAAAQLESALLQAGFSPIQQASGVTYLHRDGSPRALILENSSLGIGRGAVNYAYLFPQILTGSSPYLDDYSIEELAKYERLILAGFEWHDRLKAEAIVRQAVQTGVTVFIDMTGIEPESYSRLPRFLDVWGESIILQPEPFVVDGWGDPFRLAAFGTNGSLWHTFTPQNLEYDAATFEYLGKPAVLAGYNVYGQGKAWFIGANLAYHALQERDASALRFLSELLGLPANQPNGYTGVSLENYQAGPQGYTFTYQLDQPEDLIIPIARHDGTQVRIDGQPAAVRSVENLVLVRAPQGSHSVEISFEPTSIYWMGWVVSLCGLLGLVWLVVPWSRFSSSDRARR